MKIVIKEIEPKETDEGRAYLRIEDTKGVWYSVWKEDLLERFQKDLTYDVEVTEKVEGKKTYRNITKINAAEVKPAIKTTPPAAEPHEASVAEAVAAEPVAPWGPDRIELVIIRQSSLKAAVQFVSSKPEGSSKDILTIAEAFEKWVLR